MFTIFDTAALPHMEGQDEFVPAYDRFLAGVAPARSIACRSPRLNGFPDALRASG
jgi:hypothetical protein